MTHAETMKEAHARYMRGVQAISEQLDFTLNGKVNTPADRSVGFILIMFPVNVATTNCVVTSNGIPPATVIDTMRKQADLLEGQTKPKN